MLSILCLLFFCSSISSFFHSLSTKLIFTRQLSSHSPFPSLSSSSSSSAPSATFHPPLRHVGYIVDGNGRWAQQRNQSRSYGHAQGANSTFEIIQSTFQSNVSYITLYLFSTENWSRSPMEIHYIFELLNHSLQKYLNYFLQHQIEVVMIGQMERLPLVTQQILQEVIRKTAIERKSEATELRGREEQRKVLCLALSYGGKNDLLTAIQRLTSQQQLQQQQQQDQSSRHVSPFEITEEILEKELSLGKHQIPPPDLIIRTSGEKRLSNFFLWHAAYSELEFIDTCWPDLTVEELQIIFRKYSQRNRRFGAIHS